MELLCQKGYYPYEWVDDISKLDYDGLPTILAFNSRLKQSELTEEEYKHALRVYVEMKCKRFKDYHEIFFYNVMCYYWLISLRILEKRVIKIMD